MAAAAVAPSSIAGAWRALKSDNMSCPEMAVHSTYCRYFPDASQAAASLSDSGWSTASRAEQPHAVSDVCLWEAVWGTDEVVPVVAL